MVDLTTTYLGFRLSSPVLPSASPLTGDLDHLHALVEAGAPAVVLPSLFEEQVEHEAMALLFGLEHGVGIGPESPDGFFPELERYNTGPSSYVELVASAKRELEVPVIASLNGTSTGGWTLYARLIEDAGADAIELNVYLVPTDPDTPGQEVERRYLDLVSTIRQAIGIPLAVKIGPYFSSPANMARRLVDAGADALVLFNRFYQPDVDLETLTIRPNLRLSTPDELRLPLTWIGILYGRVKADLAATTGVHTAQDAVKLILAGANVVMMASALLRHGPTHLRHVRDGVATWLNEREYQSVDQARGSVSQLNCSDPEAFERINYIQTITRYSSDWRTRNTRGIIDVR